MVARSVALMLALFCAPAIAHAVEPSIQPRGASGAREWRAGVLLGGGGVLEATGNGSHVVAPEVALQVILRRTFRWGVAMGLSTARRTAGTSDISYESYRHAAYAQLELSVGNQAQQMVMGVGPALRFRTFEVRDADQALDGGRLEPSVAYAVSYRRRRGRWLAQMSFGGQYQHLRPDFALGAHIGAAF